MRAFEFLIEQDQSKDQSFYDDNSAVLLLNTPDYQVVIPKTEKASCYFGRDTVWHTASKTHSTFNRHSKNGELYIILHKPTNKRWQLQFETNVYIDEKDHTIKDMHTFIMMNKPAINEIIKHYGGLEKAAIQDPQTWFRYVKNPSEEVLLVVNKSKRDSPKTIVGYSEEEQIVAVQYNGSRIRHINKPSEKIQVAAVQQNGNAIRYIKKPSIEVQFLAVQQDGNAIQYIKRAPVKLQLAAVQQDGNAIRHIDSPSKKVQLAAMRQNRKSKKYIKNPLYKMKRVVNSNNP